MKHALYYDSNYKTPTQTNILPLKPPFFLRTATAPLSRIFPQRNFLKSNLG